MWPALLPAALALAALVAAQGAFDAPSSDTCERDGQYWYRMGCFDVTGTTLLPSKALTYYPDNYDGFFSGRINPTWSDAEYNNTATPAKCTKACRAAGHNIAMFHGGTCYCLKDGYDDTGLTDTPAACNRPCPGDRGQQCGGSGNFASVYWDSSYKPPAIYETGTPVWDSGADISAFLGCFIYPSFGGYFFLGGLGTNYRQCIRPGNPSPTRELPNVASCDRMCAIEAGAGAGSGVEGLWGFPLSFGFNGAADPDKISFDFNDCYNHPNPSGSVQCFCSTMFGYQAYQINDDNPSCRRRCDGGTGDCDPRTQKCCGDAEKEIFPVYIAKELTGCSIPRVPGWAVLDQDGYQVGFECNWTLPSDLRRGPATKGFPESRGKGVSDRVTLALDTYNFLPGFESGAERWSLYGCFEQSSGGSTPPGFTVSGPNAAGVGDLEACAAQCAGSTFAMIGGIAQSCYCATASSDDRSAPVNAGFCTERCLRPTNTFCGGKPDAFNGNKAYYLVYYRKSSGPAPQPNLVPFYIDYFEQYPYPTGLYHHDFDDRDCYHGDYHGDFYYRDFHDKNINDGYH
ncbi:hypothetical protein GGTG_12030 [Gaeumannomyces tritici R3-111a-1]|uniref:WSC domain-containing protein n=1 Tax=Gaeumannomyces tritici (strain R3-111a-1) TaxID=644352 RepID=J3PEV1_GAET3|nr:hypothetical protein GGTG_12030 [Gaeumannomyces tritici R3-111a-1]EJT71009.1 hypothetical protein GGTG_12030 [Gaeumannomyces tritici R3-111a-1]